MRQISLLLLPFIVGLGAIHGEESDAPVIGARPLSQSELSRFSARLKDADDSKAIKAARELGETHQHSGAALLLSFYYEGNGERRLEAVKALGALSLKEGRAALSDWTAKRRAETFLSIALSDISPAIRRQAAREWTRGDGNEPVMKWFIEKADDVKGSTALMRNRAIHHAGIIGGNRASAFFAPKNW